MHVAVNCEVSVGLEKTRERDEQVTNLRGAAKLPLIEHAIIQFSSHNLDYNMKEIIDS